ACDGGTPGNRPPYPIGLQRLHRTSDRQVGLAGARRADAESEIPGTDVLEIVTLMRAAGADAAAGHAHPMLADVFLRGEAGFPLAQRKMHALWGDVLALREGEQLAQQILGVRCLRSAHSARIAAPVYAH